MAGLLNGPTLDNNIFMGGGSQRPSQVTELGQRQDASISDMVGMALERGIDRKQLSGLLIQMKEGGELNAGDLKFVESFLMEDKVMEVMQLQRVLQQGGG